MFRFALALILAIVAAQVVDVLLRRGRLDPPGFRAPWRRALATWTLAVTFLLGIFLPATHFDIAPSIDYDSLEPTAVFQTQALFLLALAAWLALGYLGLDRRRPDAGTLPEAPVPAPISWRRLLGLECRRPLTEIALGLGAGLVAWFAVLVAATIFALVLVTLTGEEAVDRSPPEAIVWMAGLPVALRLLISLGAGVVEELFFRGFLQLRVGVGLSSLLFVGGHLGYGQPIMLVGLTLLSLFYAQLVRWRGNIWAAMAAHFLFDAIQLLLVIPAALELLESPPAFLHGLAFC